ncbi:MAG: class I SAM-dependent methyltransferase [Bacilli bacterium]|nr:MAG: class I SAM-dependent methyltransferase [Bacilli bacterium]
MINDDLNTAVNQLMYIIDEYCLQRFCPNRVDVEETIDLFIEQFENSKERSGVEKVFNKKIADSWDDKSRFVTYHGIKNPITNEVFTNIHNGMSIADIGCGTGKLISKIDSRIDNSSLFGLDISDDMVCHAQARIFTGKNDTIFINADFMNYDFYKAI